MARLSTDGTTILDNYDRFTDVPFNATKTTTWRDGTPMDDSKVDNAIYFKNTASLGGGYSRRSFEGVANVRWWGAKGDGTTDDYTALQKALNSGIPLELENGKTYVCNSALSVTDMDLVVDFNGAKIINKTGNIRYLINHEVTPDATYNVTSIVLNGRYTDITISSTVVAEKGDVFKIFSADLVLAFPDIYKGEFINTDLVTYPTGSTTLIRIYKSLDFDYATNIRISKIKKFTCHLTDPKGDSISTTRACGLLQMKGSFTPTILNPRTTRVDWPLITVDACYCAFILNPVVDYVGDKLAGDGIAGAIGYGVNDNNSYGTKVIGGNLSNLRHSFTTNGGLTDLDDPRQYGESNGWYVAGVTAKGCQTALDCHPQGYNGVFHDCNVSNSGTACQARARDISFINITTYNVENGAIIINEFGGTGPDDGVVTVDGLVMHGRYADRSIKLLDAPTSAGSPVGAISNIRVLNCKLKGIMSYTNAVVEVSDTSIRTSTESNGWASVENSKMIARNCYVESQSTTFYGVLIAGLSVSTIITDNITYDIQNVTTPYICRATNGASTGHIAIMNGNTYIGSNYPKINTAGKTYPAYLVPQFSVLKMSYKTENLSATLINGSSSRITVRPRTDTGLLELDNGYFTDPVIVLRIGGFTEDQTITTIPNGTHGGQVLELFNETTAYKVTFTNFNGATGVPSAVLPPRQMISLVFDGNAWRFNNYSFTNLRDTPTTVVGYGITDAFYNVGVIADGVDLDTLKISGKYFRGSNSGNTLILNYPYASARGGFLDVYFYNSSNGIQTYKTNNNTGVYSREMIAGVWGTWASESVSSIQTLSGNATSGDISISGGNTLRLMSLSRSVAPLYADALTVPADPGLFPYSTTSSANTNYPSTSGAQGLKIIKDGGTALGSFEFWKSSSGTDALYLRTGSGASTYNAWDIIATRLWVAANYAKTGTFTVSGSGQVTISIPHGLGAIPSFTNVNPKSADARDAGVISWTETSTNIVITLAIPAAVGTNNLIYAWEAKL